MVIRYEKSNLFCVPQAWHAHLAGTLAENYDAGLFKGGQMLEHVMHALFHHDDCWKESDTQLLINSTSGQPYDFNDFPAEPKLEMYRSGIEALVDHAPYAGLLASLHFSWFYKDDKTQDGKNFYLSEKKRQMEIKKQIKPQHLNSLEYHFRFLQFFDNLSLYLCLNRPGVSKQNEFEWFKQGFPHSASLTPSNQQIVAHWNNEMEISIHPFPFANPFRVEIEGYVLENKSNLLTSWKNKKVKTMTFKLSD